MLSSSIASLIRDEQARQSGAFIQTDDLDAYLRQLGERAEVVSHTEGERCRGFVAFYCNDTSTRRAFITLVLVAPEDRGSGLGRTLVSAVLAICRQRGFTACGLEVRTDNAAALALYAALGFTITGERDGRASMECAW